MQRRPYNCQVKYWKINGDESKEVNNICFSDINYSGCTLPDKIKYEVPVDECLNKDIVDFYLKFLASMLDGNNYECEFVSIKDIEEIKELFSNGTKINFTLNCENLAKAKVLLYLTAFRTISEFPEILIEFYKSKNKSNKEVLFKDFQECHVKFVRNELLTEGDYKYYNLSGHGLVYNYYWCRKENEPIFITLQEFQKNLKRNDTRGVQDHFRPKA